MVGSVLLSNLVCLWIWVTGGFHFYDNEWKSEVHSDSNSGAGAGTVGKWYFFEKQWFWVD